jgi:ribose transport system permease protein
MTGIDQVERDPPVARAASAKPGRARWRLPEETGVLVALIVMIAIIGLAKPRFLNPINLFTVLGNTTFQGMLSLGMVYLLAIREIDLSVGWMFNFSAVVAALLMVAGLNPWLAMVAGVAFGGLLGLVNGLLAITLRLPSIIVTLGTFSMFEGLSLVSNNGRAINPPDPTTSYFTLISAKIFGIVPVVAIVFAVLTIVLHFVLHRTRFGYRVQAVGSNPDAALLAGIPNSLVRLQTLVLMGLIAGLSGSLYVGFRGAIDPQEGSDFVLTVIAAVIIGGTPLSGGYGTVFGALIGMLIIQVIASGIIFFGIDATWSTFVTGAVIIVAVVLDQIVRYHRQRRANAQRFNER